MTDDAIKRIRDYLAATGDLVDDPPPILERAPAKLPEPPPGTHWDRPAPGWRDLKRGWLQ